ncbi:ABC-2 transporter permease [Alicyclobacillus sp. SO9]|uniref:ABC-2 transporter permease n=1 Tax=Alicyclobacillus sp. SO9 TaxID=2665646 RepID=UPI0018E86F82|nr:ABC-2 transporter permease [Alicyclobacillus sp. SO9]QQE78979.1 ABC-2 transporter permease [Alicyclobacillus sp. SO9]
MYSLLYKDWSIIKKSRAIFFGFFYFLFMIPAANKDGILSNNNVQNFFFLFIIYLFFSYITAYDYKYNGLTLMSAFPVTKRKLVEARYLFLGLVFVAALSLLTAIKLISVLTKHYPLVFTNIFDYKGVSILFLIFSMFFGIVIPLYYKLGYQKVRWVMFIAVIVSSLISGLLTAEMSFFSRPVIAFIVFIAGAIVYWSSMQLSVYFLEQRNL